MKKYYTWRERPNKNFWAFYYFLKRKGDKPKLKSFKDGTKSITIRNPNL